MNIAKEIKLATINTWTNISDRGLNSTKSLFILRVINVSGKIFIFL